VSSDPPGQAVIFLHAHLPYVRHPELSSPLAEDWLYDAITETYIPLLKMFEGWHRDRLSARLAVSLSPTLLEMLRDELLVKRYMRRLESLIDLAEAEVRRTATDDRFGPVTMMYRERLVETLDRFDRVYSRDLVAVFARLQRAGVVELATSAATHAFLPCFDAEFARAQIRLGITTYREHLGSDPLGMWLPECGFVPGFDRLLADEGIGYFFVDSHGVEFADPAPVYGPYSPVVTPSGVFAFPRDAATSAQVWSAEWGYPGDPRYREFYRDIGDDLDPDTIAGLRLAGGRGRKVGLKYHRVTGRDVPFHEKEPYDRRMALAAAREHAGHFVAERREQFVAWKSAAARPAVLVAPYDAELFGHWWFEGPEFLDSVVRQAEQHRDSWRLATPTDVMDSGLDFQVAMPAASSWGAYGYSGTWLNDTNAWIWPQLHRAVEDMGAMTTSRPDAEGLERRALNQLARELALASASDWPFIMTMETVVDYAQARVRTHIDRFARLLEQVRTETIDRDWLHELEATDNIFAYIDYREFVTGVAARRAGF
jgi:1,4-alpha-glucan branching enzyme